MSFNNATLNTQFKSSKDLRPNS